MEEVNRNHHQVAGECQQGGHLVRPEAPQGRQEEEAVVEGNLVQE